jgi:TfoX/Sxy family transcriptional regulator of competence genes
MSTPQARFDHVVEALLGKPDVTPPESGRTFGSNALKVHGKIFAMLVDDRLVVKLSRARVTSLVASGQGKAYDPRHDGRLMREWLVLEHTSRLDWLTLADEALEFTRSKR